METAPDVAVRGDAARGTETSGHRAPARVERIVTLTTVFGPLAATATAVMVFWSRGVGWLEVTLCGGMYLVTVLGVTMGYHRLFTHRAFKCAPVLRWILGAMGSMAAQGPVFFWVGSHRRHHQHSDDEGDPHSPHAGGRSGALAVLRGWWHAHIGWMLVPAPQNYFRLVADLMRDPAAAGVNRTYLAWVACGLALPAAIGGIVAGNLAGAFSGLLWGGLVRMFLVHHVTWSINSVCHLFGHAPYATTDESRNNAICAVLTLGEGWHNNHHAFPSSARHGLRWWQVDAIYGLVCLLQRIGWVWDVRLPHAAELHSLRSRAQHET